MACSVLMRQPTGQRISKVRKQQKEFQYCQSYSYVNRKVWYHQIWIPNNLVFMVLILIYTATMVIGKRHERNWLFFWHWIALGPYFALLFTFDCAQKKIVSVVIFMSRVFYFTYLKGESSLYLPISVDIL